MRDLYCLLFGIYFEQFIVRIERKGARKCHSRMSTKLDHPTETLGADLAPLRQRVCPLSQHFSSFSDFEFFDNSRFSASQTIFRSYRDWSNQWITGQLNLIYVKMLEVCAVSLRLFAKTSHEQPDFLYIFCEKVNKTELRRKAKGWLFWEKVTEQNTR